MRAVTKNPIMLGLDLGFSSVGYAAIAYPAADATTDLFRLDEFGVFRTKKETKKANVLATEDNLRRAREIATFMGGLMDRLEEGQNRLVAIAVESMSWPRNAAVVAKMGIAWGVFAAVAHQRRLPILQASPQGIKKWACGRRDASKDEIAAAMHPRVQRLNTTRLGVATFDELVTKIPKGEREHPFDALAVALTCSSAEAFVMARRSA